MNVRVFGILSALSALGGVPIEDYLTNPHHKSFLPMPQRVPCPRCKAAAGEPCDPRTLGAHPFHRARVDAFRER